MLSVEVSNKTINNIDTQNLVTSKKNKQLHGYGINSIDTITQKYQGTLSITCKNNIFTLSVILVNI